MELIPGSGKSGLHTGTKSAVDRLVRESLKQERNFIVRRVAERSGVERKHFWFHTHMDSEIVVLANSGPQITSAPPTGLANGVYLYQVAAKDPDGDRLTYSLQKSPQGMTIDPSTGLIRWEPPKEVQGKSDVPIKVSVDDGDGGKALEEYSLTLEMN